MRWLFYSPHTIYIILLSSFLFCLVSSSDSELDQQYNQKGNDSKEDDPIKLVDTPRKAAFFYDNLSVEEKTGEEMFGTKYIPSYKQFLTTMKQNNPNPQKNNSKKNNSKKKVEEEEEEEKPIQIIPLEDRWNYVINYHHSHSEIMDDELEKRYQLLINSRDNQTKMEGDSSAKNIIFYHRKAGLGNTITALADVFLLSLLSNRRFYVYKWRSIFNYLQLPYNNVSLSEEIWKDDPEKIISTDKGDCGLDLVGIINGTVTNKNIIIRTSCRIDQFFVHSPVVRKWLKDNGIIADIRAHEIDIYHRIMQFLFVDVVQPRDEIIQAVQQYKNSVNWTDYSVLGIHLRTGLLEGNVGWGRFMEERDLEYFMIQAKRHTKKLKKIYPEKEVKWFVLADNEKVKYDIQKEAGDRFITTNCTIAHSKNQNADGIFCSLVENFLLSDCNYLILTFRSTFGYLAKHRTDVGQVNVQPGSWKKLQPM